MRNDTLQHTATHCNTLQHTAAHCNTDDTLQHTLIGENPSCGGGLQNTEIWLWSGLVPLFSIIWYKYSKNGVQESTCTAELRHFGDPFHRGNRREGFLWLTSNTLQHITVHCKTNDAEPQACSSLQHTATHCNTLQHTATHCNTLQHLRRRAFIHA